MIFFVDTYFLINYTALHGIGRFSLRKIRAIKDILSCFKVNECILLQRVTELHSARELYREGDNGNMRV